MRRRSSIAGVATAVGGLAICLGWVRGARADEPIAPPLAPAAPPATAPMETKVIAPPSPTAVPREDRSAAASVVVPSDSPRAYDDLGTLLLEVPGVIVARTGSTEAYATLMLRGSNPDEVLVYVDGVPLDLAEGGGVDLSSLPLGDVERVEVYRGSTPFSFGESALGGVVSITTRTPGAPRATARAGIGSFGTAFGDLTGGGRVGRLRLYLGTHFFRSRGDYPFFSDNNTPANPADDATLRRRNNDALEGNGVLRAALTLRGRRALSLGAIGFARDQGLTGQTNFPVFYARFHAWRGIGDLRYESRDDLGPGGRLSVEAFVSVDRNRLLDPDGEVQGRGPALVHQTTLSVGMTSFAARPLGEWGRLSGVLEGRRETFTPVDELEPADSGVPARRLLGVAGAELAVHCRGADLDLIPSARAIALDDVVTGQSPAGISLPAGPARRRLLPTYRLGAVRPLGARLTLKANVGRYARPPSFLELYGNGSDRLLGDPALLPERGTNADLALWIDRPGARLAITSRSTLFGALADDLIYWQPNAEGPARATNLAAARVYGAEQELRMEVGRHLRVVAQATATVAVDGSASSVSHGRQIPHIPRYAAYARPELGRIAWPGGVEMGAYADATLWAGNYDDAANLVRAPTQVLVGAGLTVLWLRAHLRATASALNLTDLDTWTFTYWPLPGRTLFLTLAYDSSGPDAAPTGQSAFGNP